MRPDLAASATTTTAGRLPLMLQTEAAECGLACLAMVAGAHGLDTDLPSLRQRFELSSRGATLVTVIAADHPGLFYRIAGGIHLAGGNIIDARIHTTRSGWAVDNFLVQDPHGRPFGEDAQIRRLEVSIADALANRSALVPQLAKRPLPHSRARAFDVRPVVSFDNQASGRFTVIEVNARDRAALLNRLARALFENSLVVHSAHITNYGERAADTFYVTDLTGGKVTGATRLKAIEAALLEAASDERQAELESA